MMLPARASPLAPRAVLLPPSRGGASGPAPGTPAAAPSPGVLRGAALAGLAALSLGGGAGAAHAKVVSLPLSNVAATQVKCPNTVYKSATYDQTGFAPRCLDITMDATNPTSQKIDKVDVFGYVCQSGGVCERNGGGSEGASDTGRIGYLESLGPGGNTAARMVNPLNPKFPSIILTASRDSPLKDLQLKGFRATSLPFRESDKPITECDYDKFAAGCPCEKDATLDECY